MKKLLLFFAALLLCSLAHSQEAEENGKYAEFQLIPRFDFNPYFTPGNTGDGSSGFTFGNSSIYTLVEGAFSEHVAFTLSNHWAAMTTPGFGDTKALFYNEDSGAPQLFYSNTNNWLDIAKVDFTFGNWTFTVGKDCLASGGFEYDDWDVDVDYLLSGDKVLLASNLWYNLPSYQWGASVGYSIGDHTNLQVQMVTSPFGERSFASGLFSYSGKLSGNYGPFSNMWSASAIQRADGGTEWLISLANKLEFAEDFTFGFDWYNMADVEYDDDDCPTGLLDGNTFRASLAWAPEDWCDVKLVGNIYEAFGTLYDANVAAAFHYYPFEWMQLHTALGWDYFTKSFSGMAGVKINFTFLSL